MTQRTEPPDLKRHLAQLEREVRQLQRQSGVRPTTTRPKPTFGLLDAKGDLIAASAADTAERLAVGTAGQYLVPDPAATLGLKWATPNPPCIRVLRNTFQVIQNATETPLTWTHAVAPPNSGWGTMWSSSSPADVVVPWDGEYLVWGTAMWAEGYDDSGGVPRTADTGQRVMHLRVGTSGTPANQWVTVIDDHQHPSPTFGKVTNQAARVWRFNANQALAMDVLQQLNPVGPLNVIQGTAYSPEMGVTWLRP